MRVWTRQNSEVLEEIKKNGFYTCKEEYVNLKMEDFSDYYKKLYKWYSQRAEKIVPKPSRDIECPIWVSIDEEMQLRSVEGTVILELEIDEDKVIITDSEKWGYVVNFFYLPKSREDLKNHNEELEKYGIGDEAALIMGNKGNFYPLIKSKIEESWERLFEPYVLSDIRQGTIWKIKKEDIKSIHYGEN